MATTIGSIGKPCFMEITDFSANDTATMVKN